MADRGERLPKVIEVVHVLGLPAEMGPLLDLRDRYGIHIVEDAAEALGAAFADGRSVGAVGDLGCFSFNGNKMITAGGGGMIVTDDAELAHRARHLTTQARLPGTGYVHDEVGYNYRLTNIAAAVGLAQLEQLGGFLARKSQIASAFRAALDSGLGFTGPTPAAGSRSSNWLNSASVGRHDRDSLVSALQSAGISSRPVWWPCHMQPSLRDFPSLGGAVAEDLGAKGICLPSSVTLTEEDIWAVARLCSSEVAKS
jgi:dTDP-4-amino-4,6-dideoxygalactose transaminase